MKHSQPVASPLLTEDDLLASLRAQLDSAGGKVALAERLGVKPAHLTHILRGRMPVPDDVAAQLGFRRVERFEPVS